ncbi:Maf family nucleotide pyrophosphatase [Flammeovirgaceae bacterium SG7u.111]|nr:Maf family nucleotide pyrophosphatase [Flammeovirgaceae bacterium SG7u.132]WPO36286.1 Maf family nucleotide pyrophosphatase [Flammeovirgaceae bacterium SG7u.111]
MKKKVILGSNSPRRKELLKSINIDFEVRKRKIEEIFPNTHPVKEVAEYLARMKASAFEDDMSADEVVITADTIVVLGNKLYGKAKDETEALQMLKELSGNTHSVITAVCLTTTEKQTLFSSETLVTFKNLSETELKFYIKNFKPFDKAGAYGIQEWIGMVGVEKIEGSYYNVVGLPLDKLYTALKKFI